MSSSLKTVGVLTILKIFGALAGIVYSVFQVRYFGTSRTIEIFFAAQSILYMVQSLTQTGQISEVFLPEYIQLKRNHNSITAHKAFSVLINRFTVFVSFGLIVGYFLAPYIVRAFIPGFSAEDQQIATIMFRSILPLVILQLNNGFLNTVLNAEKVYGRMEIGGIINYLISIAILVLLYKKIGVWVLVWALYAGLIIQIIISIAFAIKLKIRYYFIWSEKKFDSKKFFKTIYSTNFIQNR